MFGERCMRKNIAKLKYVKSTASVLVSKLYRIAHMQDKEKMIEFVYSRL